MHWFIKVYHGFPHENDTVDAYLNILVGYIPRKIPWKIKYTLLQPKWNPHETPNKHHILHSQTHIITLKETPYLLPCPKKSPEPPRTAGNIGSLSCGPWRRCVERRCRTDQWVSSRKCSESQQFCNCCVDSFRVMISFSITIIIWMVF